MTAIRDVVDALATMDGPYERAANLDHCGFGPVRRRSHPFPGPPNAMSGSTR
jgi:hypothetical protein